MKKKEMNDLAELINKVCTADIPKTTFFTSQTRDYVLSG